MNKLLLAFAAWLCLTSTVHAGGKVLYVTHEPGRWHDYALSFLRTLSGSIHPVTQRMTAAMAMSMTRLI